MARDVTTRKPTHDQVTVSPSDLRNPPSPDRYRGLRVGPQLGIEYESNEAPPIDGSDSTLRMLSPFIMQVEPPLILGSEPALIEPGTKGSSVFGLYGTALRARSGFVNSRASLAMASYVRGNYGPGSPDEIISRASASRAPGGTRNKSGDGTRKTDAVGTQDLDGVKTGEPAIADLRTAVDIASQLKSVMSTPPLVLLINPESLQVSYSKIQSFEDRSRHGYVFQAWGETQPTLSISAKCGAFISGGRGVQWASRRDSASWQNLMTAFQFYRNNGYIYDTVGKSNAHLMVGALSIRYDQWIYFGNMQSLSYGLEDSTNVNGGVVFEMEFTVTSMLDVASSSYNVAPMRKINPNPNDLMYSGIRSPYLGGSGQSSLDPFSGARGAVPSTGVSPSLLSSDTPLDDPDLSPQPNPSAQRGPVSRDRGTRGFQSGSSEPEDVVNVASLADVEPFARGA